MEWFVPAPDGRTLAVEDAGDRGGRPVMVHVGTPGGRRLYGRRPLADAERRQVRLISYDRPGYGGSTPQPGRSISATVNGWPRTSPVPKRGSAPTRGTPCGKITSKTCTPGS
jgi:pimeloyl-ACP methyl ester carboxylesterase